MTNNPINTDRLKLREIRYSDAEAIEQYVSDKDVAGMTARIPHPYPKGEALAHLKREMPDIEKGQNLVRAIVLEGNENDLIGAISIENLTGCEPEVGYWLGKPFWGRGLMTEALRLVVDIAFKQFSVRALYARTHLHNKGSMKVLLKAGFLETGEGTCNSPAREEKIVAAKLFELQRASWFGLQK